MKNNLLIIYVSILMLVASVQKASSQAPIVQWQKNFGGSASDFAYCVIQTSDGGYITAGQSGSSNNDVTGNHGGKDGWIVKSNSAGTIDWQRSYGGTGDDVIYSIRQTVEGGFIFVGGTTSNDGDVTLNNGGEDFWVVKLDNDGNIQWQRTYGGSQDDTPFSICMTADGGYIIGGSSYSSDSDLTVNQGALDAWILKVDSAGNMQWQKSFGGPAYDYAAVVLQTSDGGYILGAGAGANGGDVSGNHGNGDVWILKLDASANVEWKKCYGSNGYDDCYNFIKTNDGGYIACGVCSANNGDVSGNHGGNDEWLLKIDSAGTIQWQRSFGGTGNEFGNAIVRTLNGGYATCATTSSTNGDVTNNHGGNDDWFLSTDSTGHLTSQKCFGGSMNEDAWSMIQTNDGGFLMAGESLSSNGDVAANYGGEDYLVIKLSDLNTGIALNSFGPGGVEVFPNPATSATTVSCMLTINADVFMTLTDMTGKIISRFMEEGIVGANSIQIDLKSIPAGLYILNLENGIESFGNRVIVQ